MSTILFWDPVCLSPYDSNTLQTQAMGGSESSLVRIADVLGAFVIQHNRTEASGRYQAPGKIPGITHVVVSRDLRVLPQVRALYPNAKLFLWLHDLLTPDSRHGKQLRASASELQQSAVTIVCVSDSQREGLKIMLQPSGKAISAHTIYNAIDSSLAPDDTTVDRNKLVFFSSPNKGLKFTLDAFSAVRRAIPEMHLVVGNPGYKADKYAGIDGVHFLGPQPQSRMHAEVRSALCTFSPNFVLPETFGLVFAESMALGTPVLAHDCGSALEVIVDPEQVLPATVWLRAYERTLHKLSPSTRRAPALLAAKLGLFDVYTDRIKAWRNGNRPVTSPDQRFQMNEVASKWAEVLFGLNV